MTPNEVMFVTKEVREGVLPRLLREILETRIVVKAAMKLAKNDKVRRDQSAPGRVQSHARRASSRRSTRSSTRSSSD